MTSCTYSCLMNVINLGNSIIGVSILAMPYCFRKCGILLSLLLIVVSGLLVRAACYLLLKAAIMARRRNFEFLAFHAFGTTGKLAVEIGIIGFLIGVCIAFFVVIGDLGPPLASEYLMVENTPNLRAEVLMFLGLFVALPLGMLRKVDSLTSLSALSIAFYGCLVLKIFSEALPKLVANEWWYEVNWWQPEGLLPCLPIFSMALSCQTQLFEFFDTLSEPSLKRMTSVVSGAVHLCSSVYILVGVFGYIAFSDKIITGNILVRLTPSVMTEFIKLGFIVTVVISFPLCLFPCRTSLHSLLFKHGLGHHDIGVNFIPDHRFRVLTISLVTVTIAVAFMLPHIEFVLGIIGSTIGTTICLIFPAVIFIHDTNKNTTEKRMAQLVLFVGVFILVACTYSTLRDDRQSHSAKYPQDVSANLVESLNLEHKLSGISAIVSQIPPEQGNQDTLKNFENKGNNAKELNIQNDASQKRQEPPIPREPETKVEKIEQNADLDPQALQKEDKEIQKESVKNPTSANIADASLKEKQEQLLRQLEEQHKEQKLILEQQKKVLEELKLHKESHNEDIKGPVLNEESLNVLPKIAEHVEQKETVMIQSGKDTPVIKDALAGKIINENNGISYGKFKSFEGPKDGENENKLDPSLKMNRRNLSNLHQIQNQEKLVANEDMHETILISDHKVEHQQDDLHQNSELKNKTANHKERQEDRVPEKLNRPVVSSLHDKHLPKVQNNDPEFKQESAFKMDQQNQVERENEQKDLTNDKEKKRKENDNLSLRHIATPILSQNRNNQSNLEKTVSSSAKEVPIESEKREIR